MAVVSGSMKIVGVVLALLLCACEGGGRSTSSDPDPTVTATDIDRPVPAKTLPAVPGTPKGWRTYTYSALGLRFSYPPLKGTVTESSATASGVRHAWSIRRADRCDPRGVCRTYEFAAVNDGCPESDPWPTFAHRWTETAEKQVIATCAGKSSFEITARRVIERPDGLRGVIYDANQWFGDAKVPGALAVVLDFPKGYHDRYEAVAFYFEDATSLSAIETVLRLVKLDT
ncbi:MAG: hypothetical protein ACRDJ1_03430 [Actinomycetota bacterium]